MRYFLIAGEPSGDQHASMLMQSIRAADREAEFRFLGGDLMERAGERPAVIHIREMAFMGFTQLLIKTLKIRKNFQVCRRAITAFSPDVVIPVDYGGFNLRMIRWLKYMGFRSVYYITPKVWAWMPSRANKLARYAGRSLCVLPFETDFLRGYGVACDYVGNPVKEYVLPIRKTDTGLISNALGLSGRPVIALLPGSRMQEISRILPAMAAVSMEFKDYQFVIAAHENFPEPVYRRITGRSDIKIVYGKTLELLRIADAALVASGTATLEAALLGTPQVVCYKTAPISYLIARILIRIRYISLVNLILDRQCVEELIQGKCTPGTMAVSLNRLLTDPDARNRMSESYRQLDERIGDQHASSAAAAIVCRIASEP
jgi:lipid-A-disaccharide synthase